MAAVNIIYYASIVFIGLAGYYAWVMYKLKQEKGIFKTSEVRRGAIVTDLVSEAGFQQEVDRIEPMRDKWVITFKNGFKIPFSPDEFYLLNAQEVMAGKQAFFVRGNPEKINEYKKLYVDIEQLKLKVQSMRSSMEEQRRREVDNIKEVAKKTAISKRSDGAYHE